MGKAMAADPTVMRMVPLTRGRTPKESPMVGLHSVPSRNSAGGTDEKKTSASPSSVAMMATVVTIESSPQAMNTAR